MRAACGPGRLHEAGVCNSCRATGDNHANAVDHARARRDFARWSGLEDGPLPAPPTPISCLRNGIIGITVTACPTMAEVLTQIPEPSSSASQIDLRADADYRPRRRGI